MSHTIAAVDGDRVTVIAEVEHHNITVTDLANELDAIESEVSLPVTTGKRTGKKQQKPTVDEENAALAILQEKVPFPLVPKTENGYSSDWDQRNKIAQWADDWGAYPREYKSYTRDEWTNAIDLLAHTVKTLVNTDPEYRRVTGLYVEEHTENLLLINSKQWQLVIEVPTKATKSGKRFELKSTPGHYSQDREIQRSFADLLMRVEEGADRDALLDLACQYLRDVRIVVNKKTWQNENPELAYLIKD